MATYTDNYHLSKPETTDSQQSFMEDYATNMEIIDENMGGGSGGGGHTIVNPAGTDMPQEPKMQFTGKVSVADDATNEKTVVTLPEEVKEVTLAEYEALPDTKLTDDIAYFIKDIDNPSVEGYPPLIYSDQEREVGVWRDGKPLYQKTYSVDNVGSSSMLVDSSMNLTNIDLVGFINNGLKMNSPYSGEVFQLGLATSAILRIWNSSSGLYCNIEGAGSGITGTCRFTVQYTKTTDTVGSGTWNGQGGIAHHYSTSETVVGTWIDGKPVYEKTFTNVANGTQILTGVSTVVDYRVSAHGTSPNSNYHCFGDGFTINSSKIFTLISGVVTYGSWTSATGEIEKDADFIVIQYTKTTD